MSTSSPIARKADSNPTTGSRAPLGSKHLPTLPLPPDAPVTVGNLPPSAVTVKREESKGSSALATDRQMLQAWLAEYEKEEEEATRYRTALHGARAIQEVATRKPPVDADADKLLVAQVIIPYRLRLRPPHRTSHAPSLPLPFLTSAAVP